MNGRHLAYPLAFIFSLWLNVPLRLAGRLGYYDNDFNHLLDLVDGPRSIRRSRENLLRDFLTDEPLFNVYHAVRYYVFGADPWPHHLLQGLLAAASAVLAFSLVLRLSKDYLLSFLFLFLFLTHPNHGEAVYWVAAVYPLMLVLVLAAAHLCLSWVRTGDRLALTGFWIFYAAAIFTHEATFGFLGVFAGLWLFERWGRWRWREGIWMALPLAAINGAYLAVRQTRWFGIGDPGFLFGRHVTAANVISNVVQSIEANFGMGFLRSAGDSARQAAHQYNLLLPFLAIVGAMVLLVRLFEPGDRRNWLQGMFLALAVTWGAFLATRRTPLTDPALTLHLAVLSAALAAIGATVATRTIPGASYLKLAAFAAVWFLSAYVPTYFLYIGERHHYLPSLGAALLMAIGLRFPSTLLKGKRRHGFAGGAILAVTAYVCLAFHAANIAEGERWAAAAGFVSKLRSQLLRTLPEMPRHSRVVLLDMPEAWQGVRLLPAYAVDAALRFWYGRPDILTHPEFVPRKEYFVFHAGAHEVPHPYDRLLLFTFKHQVLEPVRYLVFEDGQRVETGARDGGSMIVVAGQPVR